MKPSIWQQLLSRVARRQRWVSGVGRAWLFCAALSAAYALLLVLSRLLGLIPPWFTPATLWMVPAGAALLALVFHRRARAADAARLLDARLKTKDLFLTATQIDHSLGAYQGLVLAQAEERAAGVKPAQVVPCDWGRGAALSAAGLGLLCLGVLFLPQFDPLGRQEQIQQAARRKARLRETMQATALRAALLQQKTAMVQSDPVKAAVANLQKTFNAARPEDKTGTFNRLVEQQKTLGELWRKGNEEKLRQALNRAASGQNFGALDSAKAEQWKEDLQKGDTSSVQKEIDALKALGRELLATSDPLRREQLRQELMNRMQALQEALAQQLSSQPLDAALQRAMEQLQTASGQPALSKEALQALAESLNLSAEELKQLARAAGEMRSIEEALKALQAAKRLHGVKPLDGQQCQGCSSPAEYAALFNSLYAAACPQGAGNQPGPPGMGLGPGQGVGPRPHGDENSPSSFQQQQSQSALQAGKMLLSWKTRGVSESDNAAEDYRQAIEAARQQAGEAILTEQIPLPYHGAIKTYFDSLQHKEAPGGQR